jgi:hypothetical protein
LLVHEQAPAGLGHFKGFGVSEIEYQTSSFTCHACPTSCEIVHIAEDGRFVSGWGGQCDMWEGKIIGQGA